MKYVFILLASWFFVYAVPAVALFPRLIIQPLSFVAIPLVSAVIVYGLTTLLYAFGWFTPLVVSFVVWGLAIVALVRLLSMRRTIDWRWHKHDVKVMLFFALIVLPYFFKLGLYGFDRGDEIYSWNFWAIQYVFAEPIDFSHTGAAYPQLLPKLIAFCYQFLGNTQWQLPVKGTLILFTFSLISSIYFAIRPTKGTQSVFWMVLLFAMILCGWERYFKDAYADPIMSSYLLCSIGCVYFGLREQSKQFIVLGCMLAIGAFLSKQPGLIWALLGLPALLWHGRHWLGQRFLFCLVSSVYLCAVMWFATEGSTFHQNQGVVGLSFEGRTLWQQIPFAFYRHIILHPPILILFALSIWCAMRVKILRTLLVFFFVPSLFMWLIFGAYQLRLGQHLLAVSVFLIVAYVNECGLPLFACQSWLDKAWNQRKRLQNVLIFSSAGLSSIIMVKSLLIEKPGVSLYEGGKQSLYRHFNHDSEKIYTLIYEPKEVSIWVPSRYLYGLFYKHAKIHTPDYQAHAYGLEHLMAELNHSQPDYVFTVSSEVIDGVANERLKTLIQQCPTSFHRVNYSPNRFDFIAYEFDNQTFKHDCCAKYGF